MSTLITISCIIFAVLFVCILQIIKNRRSQARIDFIRGTHKAKILRIEKKDGYLVMSLKIFKPE